MDEVIKLLREKVKERLKKEGVLGFDRCEADGNYGMIMYSEKKIKPFGYAIDIEYGEKEISLEEVTGIDLAYLYFVGDSKDIKELEENLNEEEGM